VREAAESRRAIRQYVQEPVPEEDLREMLRQVRLAPSPDNLQPWRFIVVRDRGIWPALVEAAMNQRQVRSAHAVVVLYADMEDALASLDDVLHSGFPPERRERVKARLLRTFGPQSVEARQRFAHGVACISLGYLLLAAEAMGYRSWPMLGFYPEKIRQLFGLPDHVTIPALIAIGRGDEEGLPHHRHRVDRIARFV
jgi:nitroreductase